jgi:hypothetical protein
MEPVKFIALDGEDLEVVSTHVQDAIVKVSDVIWRPQEQRLVIALNRFDWESALSAAPQYRRRRAALRFERVRACKCRAVDPTGKNEVLNLLAVEFIQSDPPAGTVILTFSGGGKLRLEVECLECELADLGPVWTTACCPDHPADILDASPAATRPQP